MEIIGLLVFLVIATGLVLLVGICTIGHLGDWVVQAPGLRPRNLGLVSGVAFSLVAAAIGFPILWFVSTFDGDPDSNVIFVVNDSDVPVYLFGVSPHVDSPGDPMLDTANFGELYPERGDTVQLERRDGSWCVPDPTPAVGISTSGRALDGFDENPRRGRNQPGEFQVLGSLNPEKCFGGNFGIREGASWDGESFLLTGPRGTPVRLWTWAFVGVLGSFPLFGFLVDRRRVSRLGRADQAADRANAG